MIDVNKITSTLAKLPDQQLQQYAQMHKNDPYIMALAMSESNRRKEMRAAGQSEQGMQEQPKVVDQMVAEMAPQQLPEDMGIGQLPAGEMNFAGGGIVAFADGGDVERYQFGGVTSDVQRILQKSPLQRTPQENAILQQAGIALQSRSLGADSGVGAVNTFLQNLGSRTNTGGDTMGGFMPDPLHSELIDRARDLKQQDKLMKNHGPFRRPDEYEAEEASIAARAAKQAADKAKSAPNADAARKETRAAGPMAAASTSTGSTPNNQFDVAAMMKTALEEAEKKTDPFEARQREINTAKETQARENVTGLEAIQKQFSDIYKGKRDRLDTREREIGKMKDQSLGLALLQAGASIMSTRGSIGQAIGAGIDTGSKQYIAGLDKINSAKDKLSDARDRLDELEAQRGELSARELHKARNDVKTIATAGMEDLVKAAMAERKLNRTEAIAFVTAQLNANLKMYEVGQRSKDTQALIAARAGAAGTKEDRLKLDSLKAMAANISNELKDPFLGLPRNAEIKRAKQAELAQINAQLAQMSGLGTMLPASPAGAGSGVQFLGYE